MSPVTARNCTALAAQLRAMPGNVSATLSRDLPARVLDPLAAAVKSGFIGPYARALAGATHVVTGPPGVSVSGSAPVVSGGATADLLAPANEFGSRATQFRRARPAVLPTLDRETPRILDALDDMILTAMEATR